LIADDFHIGSFGISVPAGISVPSSIPALLVFCASSRDDKPQHQKKPMQLVRVRLKDRASSQNVYTGHQEFIWQRRADMDVIIPEVAPQ
jgi:hypothetical protein